LIRNTSLQQQKHVILTKQKKKPQLFGAKNTNLKSFNYNEISLCQTQTNSFIGVKISTVISYYSK